MNLMDANMADLIGALLGFVLTLFVFSYAWGDTPLFRFAVHLFIGVAAGYAVILTLYNVILPHLIFPFFSDNRREMILAGIYLIPAALILTKMSPRLSKLGSPAMAILVGVGAATAVGGAVMGTLFPQVSASITLFDRQNFLNAIFILVGTLTTLIYFQFTTPKNPDKPTPRQQVVQLIGWIGQAFIAVTFGALFAGVYLASLSALIERFSFLWSFIYDLFLTTFLG
jgi:hypothetical protein